MKSSDLMLGDFVTFKDCLEDGEVIVPIKIIGLGYQARGLEEEALVEIDGDKTCDVIEINDEIVGIPITPEILEKNGWEHKWWWVHPSTCICFQEKITGDFRVMPNTECDKRDYFATIKYVHELQHLYKICGIDKEIVL